MRKLLLIVVTVFVVIGLRTCPPASTRMARPHSDLSAGSGLLRVP